ncbi:MAG: Gfo/Idh/MocA family oxidoreductase [Candidatus Melainabacteria bacterium]|nr:Gfo/Idh/MocA family oxidoreductase [Candidatus Melainabacteria bacterium]
MPRKPSDSNQPCATALVGFGKIAQGYSQDKVMARVMKFASHAQVLTAHPALNWLTVIDPNPLALQAARQDWSIEDAAESIEACRHRHRIELAVLATPPQARLKEIAAFPNLKAVLIEKPLAKDLKASQELIDYCRRSGIQVQVNLLRRGDPLTRSLKEGRLQELIGSLQCASGLYGNGLKNNGLHMIDLVRMLLGEIASVQALSPTKLEESPMDGDFSFPFALTLAETGKTITFSPVSFKNWRENGLQFYGTNGRLDYLHGGLTVLHYPLSESRMGGGEMEVAHDRPEPIAATMGEALYQIYDNLLAAIHGQTELFSTGHSALLSTAVVEALFASHREGGAVKACRLEGA